MSQNAIDTLSDDTLIRMATPAGGGDAASAGGKDDGNFSDSLLMSIAQQRLSDSIDTQSGAPAGRPHGGHWLATTQLAGGCPPASPPKRRIG